jgi:hypothetical protein
MLHHTETAIVLIGQIAFAILNAAYWGPSAARMVELAPNRTRCTVVSVGYNLGLASSAEPRQWPRSTRSSTPRMTWHPLPW